MGNKSGETVDENTLFLMGRLLGMFLAGCRQAMQDIAEGEETDQDDDDGGIGAGGETPAGNNPDGDAVNEGSGRNHSRVIWSKN